MRKMYLSTFDLAPINMVSFEENRSIAVGRPGQFGTNFHIAFAHAWFVTCVNSPSCSKELLKCTFYWP